MQAFLQGAAYVFGEPRLRPYVWRPMLVAAVLFVAITVLAYMWIVPWVQDWIQRMGVEATSSQTLGTVLFFVLWWLISSTLYLGLAGLLSSFLWERLSREIEVLEGTLPDPEVRPGCGAAAYDTILRAGLSLAIGIGIVLLGWVCFGLVAAFLAGWLGLLDFTASAYARRGILLDRQIGRARRLPDAKSFLLTTGMIGLFPFFNVLLLPALVAGGTILCAKGESGTQARA
jgi:CysZ protein